MKWSWEDNDERIFKWQQKRKGRFTASQIYKLLGNSKNLFGKEGWTYIEKKAAQSRLTTYWENPKMEFVESLRWGKLYEPPAFEAYAAHTRNSDMKYHGTYDPLFLAYDDDSGGSPDGIEWEGEKVILGLEIKCPSDYVIHFRRLKLKDQWELKLHAPHYYAQIQFLLMITKAPKWHFVSYDERFERSQQIKIIEVLPERNYQSNLAARILQAVVERDKLIIQAAA